MKKKSILKIIIIFLISLDFGLLFSIMFINSFNRVTDISNISIIGTFNVDNDNNITTNNPIKISKFANHVVTISGKIDKNISNNLYLMIYIDNLEVTIKVNDQIIYEYNEYGETWEIFSAGEIKTTDRVSIILKNKDIYNNKNAFNKLKENIYLGTDYDLFKNIIIKNRILSLIDIIIIALGILIFIISIIFYNIYHLKNIQRMIILGMGVIAIGVWLITQHNIVYSMLYSSSSIVENIFNITCMYTSVMLLFIYFNTYFKEKIKRISHMIMCVICLLGLTGIILGTINNSFLETIEWYSVLIIIIGSLSCCCLALYQLLKNNDKELKVVCLFLIPLFACFIINIILTFLNMDLRYIIFRIALLITILLEFCYNFNDFRKAIQNKIEDMKDEVYKMNLKISLDQINPHFLFNSLSAISSFCLTNPAKADEAIIIFANYLRTNLNYIENNSNVTFLIELEFIKNYITLQKYRFEDKIEVFFDIQYLDFLIPPLTIEPLVEHIIKDGILRTSEKCKLYLRSNKLDDYVRIEIFDNCGFINKKDELINDINEKLRLFTDCKFSYENKPNNYTRITIDLLIKRG